MIASDICGELKRCSTKRETSEWITTLAHWVLVAVLRSCLVQHSLPFNLDLSIQHQGLPIAKMKFQRYMLSFPWVAVAPLSLGVFGCYSPT